MSIITQGAQGREVEIHAAGVLDVGASILNCNMENLMETVEMEVRRMNPAKDWYGKFAGEIIIAIKLLGEQEGENGEEV